MFSGNISGFTCAPSPWVSARTKAVVRGSPGAGSFIVSLLQAMEAGKGSSTSSPIDKHSFAEFEFTVGSYGDISLHGFTFE